MEKTSIRADVLEPEYAGARTGVHQRLVVDPYLQRGATGDLAPRRVRLVTKRTRRCRRCERVVLKPELNPSSVTFKIGHHATEVLPTITLEHLEGQRYAVRFRNPVEAPLGVTLGAPPAGADCTAPVALPAGRFWIGAFNDLADLLEGGDDDSDELPADESGGAVTARKGNVATILLERPLGATGMAFGLSVLFSDASDRPFTYVTAVFVTFG